MTSQMVLEVTGLQFHITTHSRKDEYKDRYSVKKRPSKYEGG